MEDPKGKAVEVGVVDNIQANVGLVQIHDMSASFDDAREEYRAAALQRHKKRREKRKALAAASDASSCANRKQAKIPIPPAPTACEVNESFVQFLFEKRLFKSDVNDYGRIVVPKAFAEKHLPELNAKEGIFMFLDDLSSSKLWMFRFRFWPNKKERVYVFENTGHFVKTYDLRAGDSIVVYKNNQNDRFVVGSKRADIQPIELPNNGAYPLNAMDYNLLPSFVENGSNDYPSFVPVDETTFEFYDKNILEDFPLDLLNAPVFDLPEF